jgi:predicted ATP-binding protein involved in virulence
MSERKTILNRLTLRNFRRFEEITLDLDPSLTLLVAENGGGKTAMLDGISFAFLPFVNDFLGASRGGFWLSDARMTRSPDGTMERQFPVSFEAEGIVDGNPATWSRQLTSSDGKTTHAQATVLAASARRILTELGEYSDRKRAEAPPLPVIAYFGTGRPWSPHRRTEGKKKTATDLTIRTNAYLNCLSSFSNIKQFEDWFERVVLEAANEKNSDTPSPHRPQSILAAVRRATDRVLDPSGWKTLDWGFIEKAVVAVHPEQGRLPISYLSDGVRNLLAMVADLAHRAVRLNPQFRDDACLLSPGIVLIDEVDLFLHPSWQQTVISSLRQAFPRIQFVLTTHSPQVLSTVPRECIRVLSGNEWHMPSGQTRGVESALLLAEVMGVSSIPNVPESEWVSEYMRMIDLGQADSEDALALRTKIIAHFGEHHPVVLECDRLIRWQAFKHRGSSAADG